MSPPKSKSKSSGAAEGAVAAAKAEAAQFDEARRAASADSALDDGAGGGEAAEDRAEASEEATEQTDGDDASDASGQTDESDAAGADAAPTAGARELAEQLEAATAQRDDYLQQLQRQQAEFRNYRRRVETERRQQVALGVSRLVESLLSVLDGCDAATAQGHAEAAAVGQALMLALSKAGLERIDAVGEEFDPTQHEAVIFEQAAEAEAHDGSAAADATDDDGPGTRDDEAEDGIDDKAGPADLAESGADDTPALDAEDDDRSSRQIVVEELRSGYRFDGRVLRAAMVKVRTG